MYISFPKQLCKTLWVDIAGNTIPTLDPRWSKHCATPVRRYWEARTSSPYPLPQSCAVLGS